MVDRMNNMTNIVGKPMSTTGKPIFPAQKPRVNITEKPTGNFSTYLQQAVEGNNTIRFSKHAQARLKDRNIQMSAVQLQKINDAVCKAEKKGIKESLVLMDNLALVVSVKNKTVITAVNNKEIKENVFTNIDGAVIV